jgi:hypothetical protein
MRGRRLIGTLASVALLGPLLAAVGAGPAAGATLVVGDGCTLQQAVDAANTDTVVGSCPAGSGADTIVLGAGTFAGPLVLRSALTIVGAGRGQTVIDGGSTGTTVTVEEEATVTLRGLDITNGRGASGTAADFVRDPRADGRPGGVDNRGALTLDEVAVFGNTGGSGASGTPRTLDGVPGGRGAPGGIQSSGHLVLTAVDVTSNQGGSGGNGGYAGGSLGASRPEGGRGGDGGAGGVAYSGSLDAQAVVVSGNIGGRAGDGGGAEGFREAQCFHTTDPCFNVTRPGVGGDGGRGGAGGMVVGNLSSLSGIPTVSSNTGGAGGSGAPAPGGGGDGVVDGNGNPVPAGTAGAPGVAGASDIQRGSQTVWWTTAPPASVIVPASFDVAATTTSGRVPAIGATGDCSASVDAGTATISAPGTADGSCTVTADQPGDAFYLPAAQQSRTVTLVAPAPPVVEPVVTGTVGQNGWYTSDVTLTWTVTSSVAVDTTGCVDQQIVADQPVTDYSCTASNAGGEHGAGDGEHRAGRDRPDAGSDGEPCGGRPGGGRTADQRWGAGRNLGCGLVPVREWVH